MNEKIQAILLKIILELKKLGWAAAQDWDLTLKSENQVPMVKQVSVAGAMNDDEWRDDIETHVDLKLISDDNITFFPSYTIYAEIFLQGGSSKDVVYKSDVDVAFTENDFRDNRKFKIAASRINRIIEDYMEQVYADYVDTNANDINNFKQGGYKADDDALDNR